MMLTAVVYPGYQSYQLSLSLVDKDCNEAIKTHTYYIYIQKNYKLNAIKFDALPSCLHWCAGSGMAYG